LALVILGIRIILRGGKSLEKRELSTFGGLVEKTAKISEKTH